MGRPSSKGFWTKVGSVLKAIGKWIWDNIIKPIADFFVGIYHKIKGETEKCGENWYNPATTCCTDGNKSDDMFSDKNTTLDSCPNRVQKNNDQTKLPNGCSVPVMVWPVLVIKYGAFTPDNPVSSSPDTSFRPACDRHDICYGTCNNNKNDVGYRAGCDEPFGANMFAVCNRQVDLNRRNRCRELAGEYVGRTMQFGEGNYTKAQRKECKCCP